MSRGKTGAAIYNEIVGNYSYLKMKEKGKPYYYGTSSMVYKCACPDCNNTIDTYLYDMSKYIYKFQHTFSGEKTLMYYMCSWTCLNKMKDILKHRFQAKRGVGKIHKNKLTEGETQNGSEIN